MKVAIQGAGVAGPALAHWLLAARHEVTLIEKAPRFRTGGYVIDFWGVGFTVAERMGILPAVLAAGYKVKELRLVDERGLRIGGFPIGVLDRFTSGRFTTVARGDLAGAIYRTIEGRVETLFDNSITAVEEHDAGVRIGFGRGSERDFDLLIGADGLHSAVRDLVFGPERDFETELGYRVAAFEIAGYRPRDELVYVACTLPGRQVARFAMRDDRTLLLFVFRSELLQGSEPHHLAEYKVALERVFADAGWECPRILEAMRGVDDIYFDRVSQIRMPRWSKGRALLIGDAAAAVSLLAGEGTGLAMTEAYVLAGELARAAQDYRAAFQCYERRLRAFIEGKQKSAERFASSFAPKTRFGVWLRNQATRLMAFPPAADLLIGRSLRDDFDLPRYEP